MDRWQRWREPAAIVVLAGLGLELLLTVLAAFVPGGPGLRAVAGTPETLLIAATAGAAVLCAAGEPSRHVQAIVRAGVVLGVLALAARAVGVGLLWSDGVPLVYGALATVGLVLPGLAVVLLGVLTRTTAPGAAALPAAGAEVPPAVEQAPAEPAEVEPAPADPQTAPTWQPDAAAGYAWRRAGDAAAGAPAADWAGRDDTAPGWGRSQPPDAERPAD